MLTNRWRVPVVLALTACVYLGIFLAQGKLVLALAISGITVGYGAVLVLTRGRSEAAAVLSEHPVDERRQQVSLRAALFTVNVAGAVAAVGALTELASGHALGAWGIMCAVIGVSYPAAVLFYSRWM